MSPTFELSILDEHHLSSDRVLDHSRPLLPLFLDFVGWLGLFTLRTLHDRLLLLLATLGHVLPGLLSVCGRVILLTVGFILCSVGDFVPLAEEIRLGQITF